MFRNSQSVVFAKLLSSFPLASTQPSLLRHDVDLYSGLYLALAAVAFAAYIGFGSVFSYVTEHLSRTIRHRCLQSILSQDIEFFDQQTQPDGGRGTSTGTGTGFLMTVLTSSADAVTSLSGPILGGVLAFMATILTCIVLSLAIAWRLALVCSATIPVVFACGWLRLRTLSLLDETRHRDGAHAAAYASEIVRLARTVASLGAERRVLDRYSVFLSHHAATSRRSVLLAAVLYGTSQSVVYLCAALAFWYGGNLIDAREYSLFQFYLCFAALISGSQTAGSVFSYAPDASRAMRAGKDVQQLLGLCKRPVSTKDCPGTPQSGLGGALSPVSDPDDMGGLRCRGSIELRDVTFGYASRPGRRAIEGVSLTVHAGQHVALVGPSGSGKSTIVNLLERFYDPDGGSIYLDGRDIASLDVHHYRQLIALVSQDSTLYQGDIHDNIAIGRAGIGRTDGCARGPEEVPHEEIAAVCAAANLNDFIQSLP